MITFVLERYLSSKDGTLGKLTIRTPERELVLDTLETRCPNVGNASYRGLCLPPGSYRMEVRRAFLDFEGEVRPYPWFNVAKVDGHPLACLRSFHGYDEVKGAVIQYGHLNAGGRMSDGYGACREVFFLLKAYYDATNYTFRDDVEFIIVERPDMVRIKARRCVVEDTDAFTLDV